jgi:hypothetical protein
MPSTLIITISPALILLSESMRKLLGIAPDMGRKVDQAQLYFAGGWPVKLAAGLLVAAALWFGAIYVLDGKRPTLWLKIPLLALRLIALAAVVAMLLQPMLRIQHASRQRSSVIVLADTSQSMGFRDARLPSDRSSQATEATGGDPRRMTRAEIVERAANNPRVNLLASLAKQYNVRLYTFDSQAKLSDPPKDAAAQARWTLKVTPDEARGTSTQIGAAIKRALDDAAGQPVSGALVMTDGGNNLGDDPASVAERGKQQRIPISTFGVGDPTPTRDLAITEALADQVVRKDSTVQVFAGLAHRGYDGRPATVTLRRGGETIGTKSITLGPAARKQTISFIYTPKQPGSFTYTVSVSALPGEITSDNNRRQFLQRVVTKKLKILYVDGEPRWEYRYLKNAILRDKQIEFSCFLTTSGAQYGGEGNVPIYRFPPDEKGLFAFDIVLLGDIPRSVLSDLQLRNLRRFVEDKGGSLIVIAGEKHMPHAYRDSALDAVFPVVLPAVPEQVRTAEPYRYELTSEGRQEPMLRLADEPAESLRIWGGLPGMNWQAGAERAKPGATTLIVNSSRSNSYGKRIIMAVQSFGAGRCLITLNDTTWRWRWRVGDRYFYRYWGQALRAMTPTEVPGGNRFAQVNADRAEYLLGDRVSVHARLLDSFYRPIKVKQVTGTLQGETGPPVSITLSSTPGSTGLYSADILADRIGKFKLSLASPASAGQPAVTSFLVQSIALEKQQPEMNEALLKKVAQAGGGRYYRPNELRQWLDSLKANDLIVRSESEIELWDAPIFLILFIVPLGFEWLIRKRTGML